MLFGVSGVQAQVTTFGVNVGAGQGGFSGSQEFVWSNFAPAASLFLSRPLFRGVWLQPEIGYARKVGVSTTPISRLTLNADYLEFPLLFQFRLPGPSRFGSYVHVGPDLTVRTRCTLELVGTGVHTTDDCDVVRGETSQRVDIIFLGGVGLAWMLGGTRLTIEGRAGAGLVSSAAPVDATNPRSFGWSVLFGASRAARQTSMPPTTFPVPKSPLPESPAPDLPPLAAVTIIVPETLSVAPPPGVARSTDALDALGSTRLVSVRAVNADVHTLLVAVAQQGGLDLVVDGDVNARVSVSLEDVPVSDAIRAIIRSAGLAISGPGAVGATASVVFYQLPINVNTATAATIMARFGTSAELANFIVESRPEKPKVP
jgi:hypothetical protein